MTTITTPEFVTASRLTSLRNCPRQHYYRYELGLTKEEDAVARRIGSAFHKGLELHNLGIDPDEATPAAVEPIADLPVEYSTVMALLTGHHWRYENDNLEFVATELSFDQPLYNPDTASPSRNFRIAGKIDGIVKLPDGRLAVLEYKTAGEDISPDSRYWLRLRYDSQISLYVIAARQMGYPVDTVLYDVTRKPTISPKQIPLLDEDGQKIVLDVNGQRVLTKQGKPRQTADREKGYELQARMETPEEFAERLIQDITDRPDFYYARREIPRTEDTLLEYGAELWQQGKHLRECQRHNRWFRNVGKFTCNWCEFNDLCLQGISVDAEQPPTGFITLDNKHPELEETA